jgi:hypothetical protein
VKQFYHFKAAGDCTLFNLALNFNYQITKLPTYPTCPGVPWITKFSPHQSCPGRNETKLSSLPAWRPEVLWKTKQFNLKEISPIIGRAPQSASWPKAHAIREPGSRIP